MVTDSYHVRYLKMMASKDNFNLKWTDVIYQERTIWGTIYENGSSTGMVKLIMEHQVDLTTPILCGVRNHRNLACSNAFSFDGYGAITPKIKPLPSWMGMMTPFQWPVWTLVFATLFAVTLTLGLFAKRSQPDKEIDWTLHFLDSLHPICGRNMLVPGFKAAHLSKGYIMHSNIILYITII